MAKDKTFICKDCQKEFRIKGFTPEMAKRKLCPQCYTARERSIKEKAKKFISEMEKQSKIVKLKIFKLTDEIFQFEAKFNLKDKFVNAETYKEGGIIYLSPAFYKEVDKLGKKIFGKKVSWNNSGDIGWFIKD